MYVPTTKRARQSRDRRKRRRSTERKKRRKSLRARERLRFVKFAAQVAPHPRPERRRRSALIRKITQYKASPAFARIESSSTTRIHQEKKSRRPRRGFASARAHLILQPTARRRRRRHRPHRARRRPSHVRAPVSERARALSTQRASRAHRRAHPRRHRFARARAPPRVSRARPTRARARGIDHARVARAYRSRVRSRVDAREGGRDVRAHL